MGDVVDTLTSAALSPLRAVKETVISPGEEAAKRAQREQQKQIARQKQLEQARLAEQESEVARRRALAQRPGGRSLLVATSPRGVTTLGGGS